MAKVESAVKMMEETRKMLADLDDAAPQFARQALQSVLRAREKVCREATKEAFGAEIEEESGREHSISEVRKSVSFSFLHVPIVRPTRLKNDNLRKGVCLFLLWRVLIVRPTRFSIYMSCQEGCVGVFFFPPGNVGIALPACVSTPDFGKGACMYFFFLGYFDWASFNNLMSARMCVCVFIFFL